MSMAIVVLAVLGYTLFPSRKVLAVCGVAMVAFIHPLLAVVAFGSGVAIAQAIRRGRRRGSGATVDRDAVLAIELVGLGVTSGLPFRNAAALTAKQMDDPVANEIAQALRSLNAGQPPSFTLADVQSMFGAAQASETTGMPIAGMLNALALDRRRALAAAARERLAKLPVKMLFPLALLILPGFILLTVVPPLMSGLSRLGM
jgi:pilus assembly protein TadC